MSVDSMTGFGKGEATGTYYTLTTEIKSVNNRFKDFKFRMSSLFNPIEIELRSKLENEFKRGSFDISVSYKKNERTASEFHVDPKKVGAFLDLMKPIFDEKKIVFQVSPVEFLRSDFYREDDTGREEEMAGLAKKSFDQAIAALKISRSGEGEKLVSKLLEHLGVYETCLVEVETFTWVNSSLFSTRVGRLVVRSIFSYRNLVVRPIPWVQNLPIQIFHRM
jgi:uncharacterized protein (TIGR00255 family)